MDGIIIIDKPAGWTSQDVTAKLRGVLHTKRIGHGGTLDPMATGVLPVFVGRATRAVEFFEHADKTYEAVLQLGVITDTEDTTGEILEKRQVSATEGDSKIFCYGLRDQLGILCDGTVVPCCLDHDGDLALGNLLTQSMVEILVSPRAKAIYEGFSNREAAEELCRKCGYARRFG